MRNILVVGLTGGIASGKSTVSSMLRDEGIPVICADDLARKAVEPGKPATTEIRRLFGADVFDSTGHLDRVAMARLVFRDPARRQLLESIIHPRVSEEKERQISELDSMGYPIVIVDVPLLYEASWEKAFDLIIVVYIPRELQEKRLADRDGISLREIQSRLDAQMDIEEKRKRADVVIDNSASADATRTQMEKALRELVELAAVKRRNADDLNSRQDTDTRSVQG